MTTSLVQTAAALAASPGATIATFLRGLSAAESASTQPAVTLPKPVAVSESQRAALATLAEEVSNIAWPDKRRELSELEQQALGSVLAKVKDAKKVIADAEAQLKAALFNDLDVKLEAAGSVGSETSRDKNGFYMIKGSGPGYQRTVTSPTPTADVEQLEALVTEGLLSRPEYLKITRPVRVIDEAEFLRFVAKKPEKLGVLRRAIRYARAGSVSLKVG